MAESNAKARAEKVKRLLDNAGGMDISGGLNDYDGDLSYGFVPDNTGSAQNGVNPPGPHGAAWDDPEPSRDPKHLQVEYEWMQDTDGKWSWTQTTTMGSDAFEDLAPPENAGNYRLITNTYVDYQETNLGSPKKLVDRIVSTTFANSMYASTSVASDMETRTNVSGTNTNYTGAATLVNATEVHAQNNSVSARLMTETDVAGSILFAQIAATNNNLYMGMVNTANIGVTCDAHVGPHIDMHAGAHAETHVGLHSDTHTGVHLDQHLGVHTDMHFGPHYTLDQLIVQIQGGKINVNSYTTSVEVDSAAQVRMVKASSSTVLASAVEIAAMHFKL